ncbi:hypothetical protein B0O95_111107 [Mycetohabitans endofungorum]|uniref:Uncharacterized protein n=1 Tax=Mycetohabitans endofungorum TaxID=417203 RepID=A0A2P5K8J2_9BURK|nr:hypothetical protein B0O95_111107 [Mycetohabitans endofungorum]
MSSQASVLHRCLLPGRLTRRVAIVLLMAAALMGVPAMAQRQPDALGASQPARWITVWAVAPQAVVQHPQTPSFNRAPDVAGRTVRQIVYSRMASGAVRVRLSNVYGTRPMRIGRTAIALAAGGGAVRAGTLREVTFGRHVAATIAPGGTLISDPVHIAMRPGEPVAISVYVDAGVPPPIPWWPSAIRSPTACARR